MQGVGSFSTILAWTCFATSHVMLVSVAMPAAVRTRPVVEQPAAATATASAAATRSSRQGRRNKAGEVTAAS